MNERSKISRFAAVGLLGLTLLGPAVAPAMAQDGSPVAGTAVASPVANLDPTMVTGTSIPMQNDQRDGVVEGHGIAGSPKISWQILIGEESGWLPAVGDNIIVLVSRARLNVYDRATGDALWSIPFDPDMGNPVLMDGIIYLTGLDGAFAFDAASGRQLWRFDPGREPGTEAWMPPATLLVGDPLKIDDTLYVAGGDWGGVFALDAATGEERWRFDTGGNVPGSLAAVDGMLIFASDDKRTPLQDTRESALHAVDPATGRELWSIPLGAETLALTPVTISDGKALLNVIDFATNQTQVRAYDLASRELAWSTTFAPGMFIGAMSAGDGKVFVSGGDATGVFAFDLATGAFSWERETAGATNGFAPIVDGVLYVLTNDATLQALDTQTGATYWSLPVGDRVPWGASGAQVVDGTIYVDSGSGLLEIIGDGGPTPAPTGGSDYPPAPVVAPGADSFFAFESHLQPGDPFAGPQGVAVAPDGKIYIVDALNNRIQIFEPDGSFAELWGEQGSGDGQFDFYDDDTGRYGGDLTFGSDGSIYVADAANGRIQKFDANRKFEHAWPIASSTGDGPSFLQGIALDESAGRIYIGDWNSLKLLIADMDGAYIAEWGADGAANTWGFAQPADVAVTKDGTVIVTDIGRDRLRFFDSAGNLFDQWGGKGIEPGRFNGVTSVALDNAGNIYALDYQNKRVQVFAPDGEVTAVFSGMSGDEELFSNPWSVAVGLDGRVYVVDEGFDDGLVAVLTTPLTVTPFATPVASPVA